MWLTKGIHMDHQMSINLCYNGMSQHPLGTLWWTKSIMNKWAKAFSLVSLAYQLEPDSTILVCNNSCAE